MQLLDQLISFTSRYKLLHIAFWFWVAASLVHMRMGAFGGEWFTHLPDVIIITATQMLCVYIVTGILIPRYLNQRQYVRFVLAALSAIIVTTVLNTMLLSLYNFITLGEWIRNWLYFSYTCHRHISVHFDFHCGFCVDGLVPFGTSQSEA
jgi:hypothetical protein